MPTNISIQLPESSDMNFITHPMHKINSQPGQKKYRYRGLPPKEFYTVLAQNKLSSLIETMKGLETNWRGKVEPKWRDFLSARGQLNKLKFKINN